MTRRSPSRSIAVTALLLQSLTAIFFHGVTLCIEDGSVELEFALPAECCLRVGETPGEPAVHAEECECTDLSLSHPALDKKLQADAVVLAPAALAGSLNVIAQPFAFAFRAHAREDLPLPFATRRTVVLQV